MSHPLLDHFHRVAGGDFHSADGGVTYLPPLDRGLEAVVAFTGHAVIASRLGEAELMDLQPNGFGNALAPEVLLRLADGGTIGVNDVTLASRGTGGGDLPVTNGWDAHFRVRHARQLRTEVTVYGDDRGFVTIGSGAAGRREMSIEIVEGLYGTTAGRQLIAEGLGVVPLGEWVFAAVSPGNARSLRAFLSQGFVPIASEVNIVPLAVGRGSGICAETPRD